MSEFNRRDFLTMAGVFPLTVAAYPRSRMLQSAVSNDPDFFDPWLEIDTQNLAWNIEQVRKRVENRPVMAVIKCNAYGHGLIDVAGVLRNHGVDRFAVVKVYEAVALRKSGVSGMILNFGGFASTEAEKIVELGISQSVFSGTIDRLAAAAAKFKKKARVHIKIDTGLGRVGVPYRDALSFIEKAASMPGIEIEGIFTCLTEEQAFDETQIDRLLEICRKAENKGISLGIKHAASSLAVANFPGAFLDMVRPGNCLYGIEPLPNLELKPVMSLKTRVIYVKTMRPGESVGYHRSFPITKETIMATLPLGYSDGYPFAAVNKAEVLISGRRHPMVGYMSANHVFADVTADPEVKIGDEVVLFGKQGGEEISLSEVAEWGESSVYKVAIYMNPLIPRVFL